MHVTCPGRGAAFFTLLRRAGTVPNAGALYGPGSAAHRFAKSYALRCVRGTASTTAILKREIRLAPLER
jgi:hypothetical protein